ncbi:hypothetical protein ACFXA3_33045 [Streptomyces sp. NPDC059456]|uniref:hypothetical protein n=1 Tax=Streptomyces sp. NPDC059456 TaxID=3346838 RepID=UPI0036ACC11D
MIPSGLAVMWPIGNRVLLRGITALTRLVAEVRATENACRLGRLLAGVAAEIVALSVLQTAVVTVRCGATAPCGGRIRLRVPVP